jgi:hypothetical protein
LEEKVNKLETTVTQIVENQNKIIQQNEELLKKTKTVGFTEAMGEENKEIGVEFLKEVTKNQAMILDTGCPDSLVGKEWVEEYLKKRDLTKDQLKKMTCSQKFCFGPSKVFEAKEVLEIPITVKLKDGKE